MNGIPKQSIVALVVGGLALTGFGVGAGYWLARRDDHAMSGMPSAGSAGSTGATGSTSSSGGALAPANRDHKVLYWYDPMAPNQHFDKPGKSPFMDMQLLPKYADEGDNTASLQISPNIVQNLGLRIATVERSRFAQPVEAVGNLVFNQRHVAVVQSRTNGFVSRVYNRAPGDVLPRGAPLVELLVPDWAGAQAEFLALLRNGDRTLIQAARQRLVLLGMSEELISRIESSRQQQATITIVAPIAGAIEALDIREGMTVSAGMTLAKINGLDPVWLEAQIPEAQSASVAVGQAVEAHLTAYPAQTFKGQVTEILPETNVETRATRVRVELPNPRLRLRPGMFARIRLDTGEHQPRLSVPSEAVIHTGTRNLVIVAMDANRFEPTEVQTGAEAAGKTVILSGLEEGQRVVTSGQFLIDSEASLRGVLARLNGARSQP
jgi:Cu(I)/Ag(I) efflux system membrane fusion protein